MVDCAVSGERRTQQPTPAPYAREHVGVVDADRTGRLVAEVDEAARGRRPERGQRQTRTEQTDDVGIPRQAPAQRKALEVGRNRIEIVVAAPIEPEPSLVDGRSFGESLAARMNRV